MAKKSLKEQQQRLVESYKEGRVRKSIWYRIVSVLSAITVFCTTYALILPALTQEDPTVGVKIAREFYYEDDGVAILFTVIGRAVFKDETVDIEDPQAELVELEVVKLDAGNDVYEQFSEHLEVGIGQEDLAQMLSLELKFSYLGYELDTKRCDITAQIKAKEEFFEDEIGDVPQNSEPEADHPMAVPGTKSEPAMALTAIQGTGTNVFDAPTVYATNVQEISVLTVDVKGSYLTVFASETLNPTYNVQYYAKIPTIDNTGAYGNAHSIEVINTSGGILPQNGTTFSKENNNLMNYYLKELTGVSGKQYEFIEVSKLYKFYEEVKGVQYAKAPSYLHLDKMPDSTSYEVAEIWKLTNKDSSGANESDWTKYSLPTNEEELFNFRFTNNETATANNKIFISNGDTIRLVYAPKQHDQVSQDVTMYDYDISDGTLYNNSNSRASYYIHTQTESGYANMKTGASGAYIGINNVQTVGSGTQRFAFGNNNTGTGLGSVPWSSLNLNAVNTSEKGLFGLVTGLNVGYGDYVPTFASDIIVGNLFTGDNDHDPTYTAAATSNDLPVRNYLVNCVAYYDGANNGGAVSDKTNANAYTFTQSHDSKSTVWKNLMGTSAHANIEVTQDEKNTFVNGAYKLTNTKVALPATIGNVLAQQKFIIELEFGDIRDTGNETILFADNSNTKQFCLSIENGKLCLYRNGTDLIDNSKLTGRTDDVSYKHLNGYDLASYSTIAIRYTAGKEIEVCCDGAIIFRNRNLNTTATLFDVSGRTFYIGSYDGTAARQHTTEYRSIRVHGAEVSFAQIKRNAKYNGSRSRTETGTSTNEQDIGGKTVIGGRDIVFNRVGDTYTLSAINNTVGVNLGNLTNLEYFNLKSNIITNDFWPMDKADTFGGDGNDIKFGNATYVANRQYFGLSLSLANLPVSIDSQDHNSYFGFKHKFDFYVDPDYIGPLEYFFYGDDDVWVFLDDDNSKTAPVLVCDLGGVHDPIGEYVDLRDYIGKNGLDSDGNFTLYMFYLERGGSQSTAYMRLTVPTEKTTEYDIVEGSAQLEISNTVNNIDAPQPFNYVVALTDEAGTALTGLYPYEKFYSDGTPSDVSDVVDFEALSEGKWNIQLNDDEKIVIYNLPLGTQYYITQTTRNGFYTSYTLNDNEVIKGNVDRYGNVTDEDTVLSGVLVDNKTIEVDFYNTNYAELPSTGFNGENSVYMYYVPFGIATVYMCAMPFINRTKKSKKNDAEIEQA